MMLAGLTNISKADESFIAVIIGAIVLFLAVVKRLNSQSEPENRRNTLPYLVRFEQMKADAEAKYGPSVKFLRPEMELADDPELFEQAWKEFQREHHRDRTRHSA